MPIPLAVAIAAMVAGSAMKAMGQNKADKASLRTFNRERDRQRAFEGEQTKRFEDSLESTRRLTDTDAQVAAAAAREAALTEGVKSAGPAAEGYLPGSSTENQVVAEASAKAGAASEAQTAGLARALAAMGGVDDMMQQNNIRIHRNSQHIDQIGGFKRGSLDVLQSEMEAAKRKGAALRTLGSLAQAFGQMAAGAPSSTGSLAPVGHSSTINLVPDFGGGI